jgi:hypothetical protein
LTDEERGDIDFSRTNKLGILEDILEAIEEGKRPVLRSDGSTEKDVTMLLSVTSWRSC